MAKKKKKLKKYVVTVVEKVAYYYKVKAHSYAHAEQVLDKLMEKGEADAFYDKDLGPIITVEEV
jgi:hypothetical protein